MNLSTPKFTSFRPKPKAPEKLPSEENRKEETQHNQRTPITGKSREERRTPPRKKKDDNRDVSARKIYFSDRRGDADIVKYGTLNRYDVPSYRRCGYGNVLGVSGQKIDRDYSTEKKIYMTPLVRPRQKRLLTDKHAMREGQPTLRLIKIEKNHLDTDRDFIALSNTGKRKRSFDGGSSQEDAGYAEVDYRGINEKRDSDIVDEDTYFESDTEVARAHSDVMKRNSELLRATRDNPKDVAAWMSLVDHQESIMKMDRAVSQLSVSDKHTLADLRISTYEEALRKIGDNETSRLKLHAGLLHEAQRYWDDAKLASKWEDVLKKHPHSVALWFGYLDFVQSTFAKFKYGDCHSLFIRALEALQSTGSENSSITSEARKHVFVRLTMLIQEAGYQELALAIWQAVLEFSLLAPHDSFANKLQKFEELWESEAPRIGEPDGKGWRHTMIDDTVPPTCCITLEAHQSSISLFEMFQRREVESMSKLRYPGRSTDDVGEDDPFHTIFFSDLKDYVQSTSTVTTELQVDAFLCFCGLPGLAKIKSRGTWRADQFLQSRVSHSKSVIGSEFGGLQFQEALLLYSQSPLASFQMTSDLLVQQQFSLETCRLDPDFVRNTLQLLAFNTTDNEPIGEYLLAFEAKYFPKEVVRTAKKLLKHRPTSLRLYNVYGLIESRLGNSAKAAQVFGAALTMKVDDTAYADHIELFSSWVWEALQHGSAVEALWRLTSPQGRLQDHTGAWPGSKLQEKALSALRETLEGALLKQNYAAAVPGASLLALFVYLSSGFDVTAALEVHNNLTTWFSSHNLSSSMHAEVHAQAIARFLTYHVTKASIVKPALLRTVLEPFIATFPNNTILLSTYAANEARFSIDDRVRGNMNRMLNISPISDVAIWAFAIHHETLKGEIAGSTSHSIRALYKRATDLNASGAHCPALWKMYLQFELQQLHKERNLRPNKRPRRDGKKNKWETRIEESEDRVKETFYQGLKMLPWCKDFLMIAFTDAGDLFNEEELWRLYRVMMEKELRVYTELDEPEY